MPVYTKDTTCHLLSRVRREQEAHRSHYMVHSPQLILLNLRFNLRVIYVPRNGETGKVLN